MQPQHRIVFMGTPEFAVASLQVLIENKKNVVAVITAPDKPAGRGMKMQSSAVKQFAEAHHIPVLQPLKLKDPEFVNQLKSFNADLQIVVAFRMLPQIIWNMPPLGTFNLHASLLPQYRGAAPINWAIINGEKETGVTTFFLTHEIDTGEIIFQTKTPIAENETAGQLHDRLKIIGAGLVLQTVNAIESGNLHLTHQVISPTQKPAPKIFTDTCKLNWNCTCAEIKNKILGLSPFPAAFTEWNNTSIKVFDCKTEEVSPLEPPGTFLTDQKTYLKVSATDGYVFLTDIQPQSKRRMMIADYLRGIKF